MPLEAQTRLLRVLQQGEYTTVGGRNPIRTNVRINYQSIGSGAGIKQTPRQDAVWATFERDGGASAFTNAPQMISRIGIRGRGAWVDDGRMVYHHGGSLTVDGHGVDVTRIVSRYVYELDRPLPDPAAAFRKAR